MLRKFFVRSSPFTLSPAWKIFSYTLLGIWTVVILLPFYWMLVTTFKLPVDVSTGPKYIPWSDFEPNDHAFDELLFSDAAGNLVTRPYLNTIIVAINSSLLALLIGSMAAYALTRFVYHPKPGLIVTFALSIACGVFLYAGGLSWIVSAVIAICLYILVAQTIGRRFIGSLDNSDVAFWLVSQRMLPPVAVIVPIYVMYQNLNLLNTRIGLIIAYTAVNLPLVVWFMRDYFQAIPIELEESAFIDGASRYQVLWHIVLPLSLPGLIATGIIVLIFAWNEYTLALFLTGADTQTMPILVSAQNATRGPQWWSISLLVLMMVGPIVLLSAVLERFIARGLLLGAVKG
ncbi:MAG TPA: carbohydrate ABC transporter permease [Aggregatilineales bacterium]|nr:carbohydrate ABC transporter permease [Aggregatilineales bacterium]